MRLSSLLVIAPMVAAAPRSPRGGAMIAGTVQLCAATQFENCKNQIIRIKDLDQCRPVPDGDNLSSVIVKRLECEFFTDAGCAGSSFTVDDRIARLTAYQGGKFNDNVKTYICRQ